MVTQVLLLIIIVVAALISFLATPLTILMYRKLGWIDDPTKSHHPKVVHHYPVPRGGGIPIFLSITLSSLIFLPVDKYLLGILAGLAILLIAGILDDRINPHPYWRLLLLLLAALVVVAVGIGIPYITNPFDGIIYLNQPQWPIYLLGKWRTIWVLADMFAVLWIVSLSNFTNWSSGLDGQLPGMVVIAGLVTGIFSLRFSADITQWPVIILAFITAGSYLGFLPYNVFPQKIMTGFGAGTMAGFMLAVLSILATTKVGTIAFVLAIPLVDAFYSIVRRLLRKKSPFWGDAGHLHHKLMKIGWNKRTIAFFYWTVTLILGFLALNLNGQQKFYTIVVLAGCIGGFLVWVKFFGNFSKPPVHAK
jgi:UDP-GlcNAc:undecaprenyl-phosphate GlcNAc-1-phosphate transferase